MILPAAWKRRLQPGSGDCCLEVATAAWMSLPAAWKRRLQPGSGDCCLDEGDCCLIGNWPEVWLSALHQLAPQLTRPVGCKSCKTFCRWFMGGLTYGGASEALFQYCGEGPPPPPRRLLLYSLDLQKVIISAVVLINDHDQFWSTYIFTKKFVTFEPYTVRILTIK